ncbi:gnk2-like domain-containing protein [Artemisia annua]|uniref:Gnk2-like domain-containing protein n=1 Tax=Artemisia annua TaxID=35608 RepID=A0A2U1MEW7_ARTAN|nr:gnk2-like domain-containing protein [Artemisia annua]
MATFLFFLLLLLVPNALGVEHSYHYCGSNKTTYTPNSTYYHNLVDLGMSLFTQEGDSSFELFSNITVGKRPPDIVYGLYLCRADMLPSDCLNCLIEASKEIRELCPIQKEAIRWSDNCMLHYANRSVLWNMEVFPIDYACNKANISKLETEEKRFQDIVVDMMDELVVMASNNSKRSAYKEAIYNGTQRVFGLMQCTHDLSSSDCDRCLRTHVSHLVNELCGGKAGGRLSTPSCDFRYERYKFYNFQTQEDERKAPPTTQSGKKKKSSLKIVAIITSVCIFLALLGLMVALIERRRRRKHVTRKASMYDTDDNEIVTEQSLQIDLKTIEAATANFSEDNKVGEGGFGSVYKTQWFNERSEIQYVNNTCDHSIGLAPMLGRNSRHSWREAQGFVMAESLRLREKVAKGQKKCETEAAELGKIRHENIFAANAINPQKLFFKFWGSFCSVVPGNPEEIPWGAAGVDFVVGSTGVFTDKEGQGCCSLKGLIGSLIFAYL